MPPALVVAVAEPALDFALRHRDKLFPNAPILFGLMDQGAVRARAVSPNVTGVVAELGARSTLETALKLHPGTRNVVVVGGTSAFDRAWLSATRQDVSALESRVSFTYVTAVPFTEMLAHVASLRDNALVLFVTMTLDGGGVPRVPLEVVEALRSVATVPVYGMSSSYLGHGIVGGVMVDLARHGTDLGLRAHDILSGAGAGSLPLLTTANLVAFDGRELERFGVEQAWLPPGATVTNREVSPWEAYRWTILAVCALLLSQAVLIGALTFQRRTRRRAELALHHLSGRLLSAQEEERRRIGRELHDNLSQQVALLAIEIEQVAMKSGEPPAAMARSMRRLGERTAEISTEIHNLSHRLHSSKLEALGLVSALRGHCQELLAQGLRAHFLDENVPRSLPDDVELCLFRIVQEALTNVVKHSGVREAHVTLNGTNDALLLRVVDFGRGFDEVVAAGQDGLGLASMRERLRLIGGDLIIRSRPSRGTTIDARVPLPRDRRAEAADTVQVA